jgi:hydroxymethylbilane synthase
LQSQAQTPFLRIGTRGSQLAMAQATLVRRLLAEAHEVALEKIEIVVISTSGDRITDRPLSEVGGKGLFTKEIEAALLAGEVDLGVHSSKDVATILPDGLVLPVFLPREDVRDAFVSRIVKSLDELPEGARLGTSSIRRAAQMQRYRPDLRIVPFRGNVDTRLKKLDDGVADATLLAAAGLNRLGRAAEASALLDPETFPTAPAQGAIGLEIREGDTRLRELIAPLGHAETNQAIAAERALLRVLDGSCRTPIGAFTRIAGAQMSVKGQILSPDGKQSFETSLTGPAGQGEKIGAAVGGKLLEMAGPAFLDIFKG